MKSTSRNAGFSLIVRLAGVAAIALAASTSAHAGFVDYIIRGTPTIDHTTPGQTTFVVINGGEKAGLGSNDINGKTLGEIASLKITRLDNPARFTAGSGPQFAPYVNFWITDGLGKFAVVANEPTDPNFQPLYNHGYALDFSDLSNKAAHIHESSDQLWLANNSVLTFSELSTYMIQAPTVAQLTAGWTGLGTGAPRQLGTNVAYGVNWVFGDTAGNYVSGPVGYTVADANVTATPEPGTSALMLAALGTLGAMLRRRKS